jgi:predicted nicotinamide N-methyase
MNDSTRRGFLTVAGLGTAAGVAAVAAPAAHAEEVLPAGANGAMAAYIHDLKKSEVAIMVKGGEVVVTDKQLVARLARAFERANKSVGR